MLERVWLEKGLWRKLGLKGECIVLSNRLEKQWWLLDNDSLWNLSSYEVHCKASLYLCFSIQKLTQIFCCHKINTLNENGQNRTSLCYKSVVSENEQPVSKSPITCFNCIVHFDCSFRLYMYRLSREVSTLYYKTPLSLLEQSFNPVFSSNSRVSKFPFRPLPILHDYV